MTDYRIQRIEEEADEMGLETLVPASNTAVVKNAKHNPEMAAWLTGFLHDREWRWEDGDAMIQLRD